MLISKIQGFDRESLINVALLVGSDYTEGIESVGVVKTVEIFQEFEGNGIEKLQNFKYNIFNVQSN
jgi:DNA excision repair protein ERCC-5